MKNVYILTEEGRAWGDKGMQWIEEVFKPWVHETDQLTVCMGLLYNGPGLMVEEIAKHPDSYVIVSHERISAFYNEDLIEFSKLLQSYIDKDEYPSSWKVAMEFIHATI